MISIKELDLMISKFNMRKPERVRKIVDTFETEIDEELIHAARKGLECGGVLVTFLWDALNKPNTVKDEYVEAANEVVAKFRSCGFKVDPNVNGKVWFSWESKAG